MRVCFIAGLLFLVTTTNAQELLVPYRIKDKWGYSNIEGKIVIQPKFQGTSFFKVEQVRNTRFEFAEVLLNNKTGLIDRNGKLIVPNAFSKFDIAVWPFCLPITANDGHTLYSLQDGKMLLDSSYSSIQQEAGVNGDYSLFFATTKEGKVGIYDGNRRKWIAKPDFDAIVAYSKKEVFVRKGNKKLVVDLISSAITPFVEKDEKLVAAKISSKDSRGESSEHINRPGEVFPNTSFDLKLPEVIFNNGKYGYRFIESFKIERSRNANFKQTMPDTISPQYDSIDTQRGFMNRLAVKQNGKWGIVDNKNSVILPIRYSGFDIWASNAKEDIYVIRYGSKLALVDKSGDTLIHDCDEVRFVGGYQLLRQGRLYGAYIAGESSDFKYTFSRTLIPIRYNRIERNLIGIIYEGRTYPFFYVQNQNGSGYLSPEGKEYFE